MSPLFFCILCDIGSYNATSRLSSRQDSVQWRENKDRYWSGAVREETDRNGRMV